MRNPRTWAAFFAVAAIGASAPAWAADISTTQVGFTNGDDWEPAIAADGAYLYVLWPNFDTPTQPDTSGATCQTKQTTSWMYFQRSTDGGAHWDAYVIPRCPVVGTQIDAQIVIGPNHRVYASYMDGPQANSNIEVIYSDDHGATWSTPVNAAGSGGGDKDILLVDATGGVQIAYEHLSSNYVAYSPNVATTAFTTAKFSAPADEKSGTSLADGGVIDTKGNTYFFMSNATGNAKGDSFLWVARSTTHFTSYTATTVDRSFAQPQGTGAGWDYWGASGSIAVIPKSGSTNDRVVVTYNAGTASGGAERIYTKYSDTLGASWNVPYNASSYPNGAQLSLAPTGAWHGFSSIAGNASGVKSIWMDNRVQYPCTSSTTAGACGLWNVYERSSADGVTWSAETKMQLLSTHSYQPSTPAPGGFFHPYGDYSSIVINAGTGTAAAVWGEGTSYVGPGTIYVAPSF